jgi:hypothetical protein
VHQTGIMSTPNRSRAAIPTAITTATALASTDTAGIGNLVSGSSESATKTEVNTPATAEARPVNRRTQPRTVDTGRPNVSAIFR